MNESCGETRRGGRLPESLPLSVKRSIFVLCIYRLVRRIIVINIFDICQIPPVGIIRLKHPPVQILRKNLAQCIIQTAGKIVAERRRSYNIGDHYAVRFQTIFYHTEKIRGNKIHRNAADSRKNIDNNQIILLLGFSIKRYASSAMNF